jgi:hypothetical protein
MGVRSAFAHFLVITRAHPHYPSLHARRKPSQATRPDQSRERISFVLSNVQRRADQQLEPEAPPSPPPRAASPPAHLQPQASHRHHHHRPTQRETYPARDAVEVAAALEYRDPQPTRQRHHYYHDDVPLPPPVPALPQRRGPSCACSLACVALLGCVAFSACMLVELSYVNLDTGGAATALQRRRDYARHMREQQHKLGTAAPPVRLGLWDENTVVTPLQLTVALSLALGIDERSIRVVEKGSHFFDVWIEGEGDWLVEMINSAPPASSFFYVLNAQAAVFGAKLVVSNQAVLVASNGTAANAATRYA